MSTTSLEGIVKAVLGGNTIKICHPQFYDREKTLILADVKSPRFAPKDGEDEKWAFEAREFLRKKLIGKSIRFRVDYTVKETGMNYATIYLEDENINESVVDAGWGKVKTDIKNPSDDLKRLIDLQKTAQEQHLGMWSNKENYAKSAKNEDPQALLKSFKGKTVDVIVEYVISGTALKVRLPTNEVVVMNLTGVYCPSVTKDNATKQKVALPFSKEAKTHTEVRLLNRDVTVLFEGIDNGSSKKDTKPKDNKDNKETKEKTSNLHGSIIISADETSEKPVTYQEELLMIGYVSVDERSAPKSKYAQRLRAAEQKAKSERKNLWIDYVPPKVSLQQADNDFSARVLDVLSGDTLKIVKNDGKEEKISLSNIRTKKFISYTKKPEKKEKDAKESTEKKVESEPWAWEARELLRSKVAGKEIHVEVDYRKEFGSAEKKEERRFCTVLVNKKSIAVELVREGFAEVIKIKADEERSSAFDQLILAENEAIKRQKGLQGKKKAPNHLYSNVTGDAAVKLNKLLTGKSGNTKAVVEKVLSASKFILSLPNDNSVITFSLTGIAIPSSDRNKELAEEARQLTLITASCRDVELVLEPNVDKAGSFVGQLLIGGKNYANTLLEAGLAIVQPYAKRLKIFEELNESEAKGKKAKKGVWKLEDHTTAFPERKKREQPEQQEKPVAQKFTVSHSRKTQTIRVTDFEDPVTFFYQGSDVVEKLKTVENLIAQLDIKTLATLSSPVVGSICLSQFTDDECWYRAKIISINGAKAVVLYSDFGNSEEKELSTLKEIPAGNQLLTIPDCAQKARLAFVKPHSQEFRFELETLLRDTLLDGEWQLTVEYSNNGVNYVTLVQNNGKSEDSLNKQIIRSGLVFADKEVLFGEFRSIAKSFIEEQEFAISRRLNLWELGEIYESDEEEI